MFIFYLLSLFVFILLNLVFVSVNFNTPVCYFLPTWKWMLNYLSRWITQWVPKKIETKKQIVLMLPKPPRVPWYSSGAVMLSSSIAWLDHVIPLIPSH